MSDSRKQQLADLERSKRQWEDDPDQHTPFPLEGLVAELRKKGGAGSKEKKGEGEE